MEEDEAAVGAIVAVVVDLELDVTVESDLEVEGFFLLGLTEFLPEGILIRGNSSGSELTEDKESALSDSSTSDREESEPAAFKFKLDSLEVEARALLLLLLLLFLLLLEGAALAGLVPILDVSASEGSCRFFLQ